ncbi:MAG: molecular chaperone DnaJ [Collimonas sp.]|uniref:molecular chaperone DnaJ n=1 Tax=Collimonas sp. TaxID=1963772 RepID=UPI0032659A8D
MKKTDTKALNVVEQDGQASLSPGQKIFNDLIKKIETERQQLAAWQDMILQHQKQYVSQFQPLIRSYNGLRVKLVRTLDRVYSAKGLSKSDQEKISHVICTVSAALIAGGEAEDLKPIYNMHSHSDFDAAAEEDASQFLPEREPAPEANAAYAGERTAKRKKSAKATAKEAALEEEQKNVSQSIREVYRKLASALHPDREQDALERVRKTVLMQRVNIAYDKKDLLGLLELQLEIEQIDQAKINSLSEARLKHYNKVLTEQAAELREEIAGVEADFRTHFHVGPKEALSPALAMRYLKNDIREMQQHINALKNELLAFDDVKNIKVWLKSYRI